MSKSDSIPITCPACQHAYSKEEEKSLVDASLREMRRAGGRKRWLGVVDRDEITAKSVETRQRKRKDALLPKLKAGRELQFRDIQAPELGWMDVNWKTCNWDYPQFQYRLKPDCTRKHRREAALKRACDRGEAVSGVVAEGRVN